jgi:hypothetical protein
MVDEDRVYSGQRGQSVYWSIGMSMGWDCGPALGAAAAFAKGCDISLRTTIGEAEEV